MTENLYWKPVPTKVPFFTARPTQNGKLQLRKHQLVLPTREHALIFACFCASGNIPEAAFLLHEDFLKQGTGKGMRFYVDSGTPCIDMPPEY